MTVSLNRPTSIPTGWWRVAPDSSVLPAPRSFTTIFVPLDEVQRHVETWARAYGTPPEARLPLPDMGLLVMTVGGVAVIGATEEALAAVGSVRTVVVVPQLDEAILRLEAAGATVVNGPIDAALGRAIYVVTSDGALSEWVEHRPLPGEVRANADGPLSGT